MKKQLQIGITGGIGAGKSLVTQIFHVLGTPVYDADTHAKELMNTDPVLIDQIKKEFGALAYSSDGEINRKYLSAEAFAHGKVELLNKLVHPRVALDYEAWAKKNNSFPYLMKEAALLFEAGSSPALDKIIVVTAPESLRIKRVLQRDPQRKEDEVRAIIGKQIPEEEKIQWADFLIQNDESSLVIPQVLALHRRFTRGE